MTEQLAGRILEHAMRNRQQPKWKARMFALLYGCRNLVQLNKIK